jgi:hypothetical protein
MSRKQQQQQQQQQRAALPSAATGDDLSASSGSFTPKSECRSDCDLLESGDSAGWNSLS